MTSAQKTVVGALLNQLVVGVVWPVSLMQISFAYSVNQPIAGVVWPAPLRKLSLGQPIAEVVWPVFLIQQHTVIIRVQL